MTDAVARQRWLGRLTLRNRIGLLVTAAVGLAVAFTSLAAYVTTRHQLAESVDDNLVSRAEAAVSSPLGNPAGLAAIPSEALGAADLRIALVDARGIFSSSQSELSAPPLGEPELAVAQGKFSRSLRTAELDEVTYRVVAVPAGPGRALVLAQSTEPSERTLSQLGTVLLIVGGVGVLLAALAGLSIAHAALRPVDRLTAATEHVARTDELRPIAVRGDDELARLTRSFNAMLATLAQSRQRQQQLVADAGHELRTPLTSLRTNLDLLRQSTREGGLAPDDRDALLTDVRAQTEEMSDLVGDLVELARGDSPPAHPREVDLGEVVERALERVRLRAPTACFAVDLSPWEVYGEEAGLERAVTNLLDNAAKWSPPAGTVTVRLAGGELRVSDEGPGIAEADLPFVFERFYRAPEARTLPGSGLGLAIVRQVVERHGGTVRAERAPGAGALLVLWLPGRAPVVPSQP